MENFDTYYNGLLTIVSAYKEDKAVMRELIKTADVPVTVLSEVYLYLLRTHEIKPLEDLPQQEKDRLWKEASLYKEKIKRVQYCRASYLLSVI